MGRADVASTLKVGNRADSRIGMCWGSSCIISPRNSNHSQVTWLHWQPLVIFCVSWKMCDVFPLCTGTSLEWQTRPKYSHKSLHLQGKMEMMIPVYAINSACYSHTALLKSCRLFRMWCVWSVHDKFYIQLLRSEMSSCHFFSRVV